MNAKIAFGFVLINVPFGISIEFLLLLQTSSSSSSLAMYLVGAVVVLLLDCCSVVQMNPFTEHNAAINEQMK